MRRAWLAGTSQRGAIGDEKLLLVEDSHDSIVQVGQYGRSEGKQDSELVSRVTKY